MCISCWYYFGRNHFSSSLFVTLSVVVLLMSSVSSSSTPSFSFSSSCRRPHHRYITVANCVFCHCLNNFKNCVDMHVKHASQLFRVLNFNYFMAQR